jgi:hypothetical protein
MLVQSIIKGATDQSIVVMLRAEADGQGLTGLAHDTAGLTAYYKRGHSGAATAITLATLASGAAAHADGGFVAVDGANMPGVYRLDLPDAAVASGAPFVTVGITGAAGLLDAAFTAPLVDAINVTSGKVEVKDGGIAAASLADGALADPKFQTRPYLLVAAVASGSGTTAVEVDPALYDGAVAAAKASDYFNGWVVRGVSGANRGLKAAVSDWANGSATLTVGTIAAPADGDLFQLYKE